MTNREPKGSSSRFFPAKAKISSLCERILLIHCLLIYRIVMISPWRKMYSLINSLLSSKATFLNRLQLKILSSSQCPNNGFCEDVMTLMNRKLMGNFQFLSVKCKNALATKSVKYFTLSLDIVWQTIKMSRKFLKVTNSSCLSIFLCRFISHSLCTYCITDISLICTFMPQNKCCS